MKTLENKTTEIQGKDGKATYFELAETCLNHPPQGGFDVKTMNSRMKVLNKLEGEKAELEDAEWETLKNCVQSMRWGAMHKDLVEFSNQF